MGIIAKLSLSITLAITATKAAISATFSTLLPVNNMYYANQIGASSKIWMSSGSTPYIAIYDVVNPNGGGGRVSST